MNIDSSEEDISEAANSLEALEFVLWELFYSFRNYNYHTKGIMHLRFATFLEIVLSTVANAQRHRPAKFKQKRASKG